MLNKTIQTLEAMDSGGDFERLCSTLLLTLYKSINPIGGSGDKGKDATGELWEGTDQTGRKIVFAFSVQETWEAKLRGDLKKARDNKLEPARFVFVTNRHVTNARRFKWEADVPKDYGWEFELYDQEWVRTRLEHPDYLHLREQYLHLAPETLPAFLSKEEFFERQQRSVLVSFDIPFAGRVTELQSLAKWASTDSPVLVVHGAGGLGKSRLCYEFAESLLKEGDVEPVFLRINAEEFESHLAELVPNKKYVVIVDDAHRFEHLLGLEELIVNKSFNVKLLLNTRPVFRHQVTAFADGKYEVEEFALPPLDRPQLDKIISGPPFSLQGNESRAVVLDVAQGSPLIAHLAARMVAEGQDIRGLTADDVLKRYLNELVQQVLGEDQGKGRDFLAVLAGMGSIDGNASALVREALRERLALSVEDESRLIGKLLQGGILHRGYRGLRITPDILGDHLVQSWFFDQSEPRYNFKSTILEPFFRYKPADIMRNLAEAEYRDEASEAGSMLSEVLDEFATFVVDADNNKRLAILQCLAKFALLRPDEALYIVAKVLTNRNPEPAIVEDPSWGRTTIREDLVLAEAVEILDRVKYRQPKEALENLLLLAQLPDDREMWYVRKKANEAIDDLFKLKPRTPWAIYDSILQKAEEWMDESAIDDVRIVALLSSLLHVHMNWAERSPTDRRSIVFGDVMLTPSDELRKLRASVFRDLRSLYAELSSPRVRKKIVDAHDGLAVVHPARPDESLQSLLNKDVSESIQFFMSRIEEAELYERFEFWAWAKGIQRHGGYTGDIASFLEVIEGDAQIERYLLLADYPARYREDHDWKAADTDREALIASLVDEASPERLEEFTRDLEEIVAGARLSQETEPIHTGQLLRSLSLAKPELAEEVLRQAAEHGLQILHMAHWALAGLRLASPGPASSISKEWTASGDSLLGDAVARSYWWPDGTHSDEDFELIEELEARRVQSTGAAILRALPSFQTASPKRTIAILKGIAGWAPDWMLATDVAQLVHSPWDAEGRLHILELSDQDVAEIVWQFARLQRIDSHQIDQALQRFLRTDPVGFLRFLRHRIVLQETSDDRYFDAVPYDFHAAFEGVQERPEYPMLLRELREWVHESGGMLSLLSMEASRLLKQLTSGQLNESVEEILGEWIPGSVEQLRSVAQILREFGISPQFYVLARRLIDGTDDEVVLAHISSACGSTGVSSVPLSVVFADRIPVFRAWSVDPDSSVNVRVFARRMIRELTASVEQHEEIEEDREREYEV